MRAGERGSASLSALLGLCIVALAGASAAILLGAVGRAAQRSDARSARRSELELIAREAVSRLALDPTPDADCARDPVWSWARLDRTDGAEVRISDLSSALDANWVQKSLLLRTGMSELLSPGGADELQQRRVSSGFSADIGGAYGDLFGVGALERYFTGYGYANVNTTDEFALRELYRMRTGDADGAELFHRRIQEALESGRIFDPRDLPALFGEAYPQLFPVMNAEPALNVHFLDPGLLLKLLSHPAWHVPDPAGVAEKIEERRESVELTAAELGRIIGAPEESRLHQYLGVVTWFWLVSVSRRGERIELVVARLPSASGGPSPRLLVVEERYSK